MNQYDFLSTEPLTLTALNAMVKQALERTMPSAYWVQAELASVNDRRGHCYMELVEKSETDGVIEAQARACCWKKTWMRVGPKFMRETGETLHSGMKVLMLVRATFHEAYGFSWVVNDIDPTFTIGDMARRRQEIIRQLTQEGVIDLNKQLPISPFCKRIAVISSATAAGYGDFCNQLMDNEYGFQFSTRLFPAIMQGEQVERSIIDALNKINEQSEDFDCVIIIRGGGSTTDLSGFDTLALAENVANFPLPIITGIGHERDKSILDIVACVSVKTPTAVAEFLIANLTRTLTTIGDCALRINNAVREKMEHEKMRLQHLEQRMNSGFAIHKTNEESRLQQILTSISYNANRQLFIRNSKLQLLEQRITAADPKNILKKGYSIVLHKGTAVTNPSSLHSGDAISIMMANGIVEANVQ